MKKMHIISCCLFTLLFLNSATSFSDCLVWTTSTKLTWDDFKGYVPGYPGTAVAMTYSSIKYRYELVRDSVTIESFACFSANKSWVIVGKKSDRALNHEQRHFDICELHARKFREYAMQSPKGNAIANYLKTGCDSIRQESSKMQDLFDAETEHSKNFDEQIRWDKKIDSLLLVYDAYKNPLLKVPFK